MSPRMAPGLEYSLGWPDLTLHCPGGMGDCSRLDLVVLRMECRPLEIIGEPTEW